MSMSKLSSSAAISGRRKFPYQGVNCLSDGLMHKTCAGLKRRKTGLSDIHDVLANGEEIRNAVVCPWARPLSFAVELPHCEHDNRHHGETIRTINFPHSTKAASTSRAF